LVVPEVFEVWALLDELRRSGGYRGCFVVVDVCEVRVVIEYILERFVELVV